MIFLKTFRFFTYHVTLFAVFLTKRLFYFYDYYIIGKHSLILFGFILEKKISFSDFLFGLKNFLYGYYYPLVTAFWVFLCYAFNIQTVGLLVMIAAACFFMVFIGDMLPILPLFAYFLFLIRDFTLLLKPVYIVFYILLVLCLIFHFIKYRPQNFIAGKLFFPLILVTFALTLGGIFSVYSIYWTNGLPSVLAVGPLVLLIYSVFMNGINAPYRLDLKKYICNIVVCGVIFCCFELLVMKTELYAGLIEDQNSLTWGSTNTLTTLILIAVPCCFYLMIKTGKVVSLFSVIAFFTFSTYIAGSDGCLGILIFTLPFLVILTYLKLPRKYRREFMICIAVCVLGCLVFALLYLLIVGYDTIFNKISDMTSDSGRILLYEEAINLFNKNPFFGAGLGFIDESLFTPVEGSLHLFNFHSTVFHVLATLGIFGVIAYFVYYALRFSVLFGGNSDFNAFIYVAFIDFTAYGLIDVCEFNVVPILSYITLLFVIVEKTNAVSDDKSLSESLFPPLLSEC